jgi:hypothetical protein
MTTATGFFAPPPQFRRSRMASTYSQDKLAKIAAIQFLTFKQANHDKQAVIGMLKNFFSNVKNMGKVFIKKTDYFLKTVIHDFLNTVVLKTPILEKVFETPSYQVISDLAQFAVVSCREGLRHAYQAIEENPDNPKFKKHPWGGHTYVLRDLKYMGRTKMYVIPKYYDIGFDRAVSLYNKTKGRPGFNLTKKYICEMPDSLRKKIVKEVFNEVEPKLGAKTLVRYVKNMVTNAFGLVDIVKAVKKEVSDPNNTFFQKFTKSMVAGAGTTAFIGLKYAVVVAFMSLSSLSIGGFSLSHIFGGMVVGGILKALIGIPIFKGIAALINKWSFDDMMWDVIKNKLIKPQDEVSRDIYEQIEELYAEKAEEVRTKTWKEQMEDNKRKNQQAYDKIDEDVYGREYVENKRREREARNYNRSLT